MKIEIVIHIPQLSPRAKRIFAAVAIPAILLGGAAVAWAGTLHTWSAGDTLTAQDLNDNFAALDAKEPFAGTFPAVLGLGTSPWFCADAVPPSLNISSALAATLGAPRSNAFGGLVYTNQGKVELNLSFGDSTNVSMSGSICTSKYLCASPLTYFLRSPSAQTIQIKVALDDVGAYYLDGVLVGNTSGFSAQTASFTVPQGSFAISFVPCSDLASSGNTLEEDIFDVFLVNPAYGLTVDYDRTFHRNGK